MKNLETSLKISSATIFVYYLLAHHVHINLVGSDFYSLHKLTDEIWKETISSFDGIAEEIRSLDIFFPISLGELRRLSVLEDNTEIIDSWGMIHNLLLATDVVIDSLTSSNAISQDHPGLQNFLQDKIDKFNKFGWMLRATTQKQ